MTMIVEHVGPLESLVSTPPLASARGVIKRDLLRPYIDDASLFLENVEAKRASEPCRMSGLQYTGKDSGMSTKTCYKCELGRSLFGTVSWSCENVRDRVWSLIPAALAQVWRPEYRTLLDRMDKIIGMAMTPADGQSSDGPKNALVCNEALKFVSSDTATYSGWVSCDAMIVVCAARACFACGKLLLGMAEASRC